MKSKICLITGANAGIGREAAVQLAQLGYHVLIGSRNKARGERALETIKSRSNSEHVELVQIDLASKESIRKVADYIRKNFEVRRTSNVVAVAGRSEGDHSLVVHTPNLIGLERLDHAGLLGHALDPAIRSDRHTEYLAFLDRDFRKQLAVILTSRGERAGRTQCDCPIRRG